MYLVKRPIQKPPFATIYEFERWLRDPWQAAASERSIKYQDKYKFVYKKKWQDMYQSASAHTSIQFKIQSKFIYAIIAIVCLMSLSWFLFTKSGGDKLARQAIDGIDGKSASNMVDSAKNQTIPNSVSNNQVNPGLQSDLSLECRKAVNVEKPEYVKWFNDLSNTNSSVTSTGEVIQTVSYNPNSPYDFDYIPQNVQPTDFPRMSGVVKLSSGRLMALDQQGNYMPNVSISDCQRWLDGYRPFNYFASNQTRTNTPSSTERVSTSEPENQNSETSSL